MMTAVPGSSWPIARVHRRRGRTALARIGWAVCLLAAAPAGRCADPAARAVVAEPPAADVAAIRAAAAAYREALARNDVAVIRRAWTADGDVVDGWGNLLAVGDVVAAVGQPDGDARPQPRPGETRLRFITPDVAVEDGGMDVIIPGMKTPLVGWFSAIWARRDGEWKLAGIREAEHPAAALADTLDDLEWMVGDWVLALEGGDAAGAPPTITMTVRWDAARMFLLRDVRQAPSAPEADGAPVVQVQQRIGWDPLVGRIRSWSFATDGSRAEATWFRDGTSWVVRGTTIQPDGTQTTSVNIYTPDGQDRCVWRTMEDPLESSVGLLTRATWIRQQGDAQR